MACRVVKLSNILKWEGKRVTNVRTASNQHLWQLKRTKALWDSIPKKGTAPPKLGQLGTISIAQVKSTKTVVDV